jgi:hypothetical protein
MTIRSTLLRLERALGTTVEHEYSLYQLLHIVDLVQDGKSQEEAEALVGPPERPIVPGQPSLTQILEHMDSARSARKPGGESDA